MYPETKVNKWGQTARVSYKHSAMIFRIFLFAALLISITVNPALAQFEGKISFDVHQQVQTGIEELSLDMIITKDRMLLESSDQVNVMAGLNTDKLLVRNDHQDFVFHTGTNEAMKITKSDLDGLVNLMKRFQGRNNANGKEKFDWDTSVIETGNTKTLHGYTLREFQLKTDQPGNYSTIWLTDDIKVNWGLLSDFWYQAGQDFTESELPVELIMNRNSFPLVIEIYQGNQLVFQAAAREVNTGSFDRSGLELSESTRLLGLTDLMMNMFRNQR